MINAFNFNAIQMYNTINHQNLSYLITRTVQKMNLSHSSEAYFNCKTKDMLKFNVYGNSMLMETVCHMNAYIRKIRNKP